MTRKWKYEILICWSEEDQACLAEVPELPGCMADGNGERRESSNSRTKRTVALRMRAAIRVVGLVDLVVCLQNVHKVPHPHRRARRRLMDAT